MNVLVTSAGRRSSLVVAFREAVAPDGRVVTTDVVPHSAGLLAGDVRRVVPPPDDPRFVDAIEGIVRELGVRLVVPTLDRDLAPLAAARDRLARSGAVALTPDPAGVALAADKWALGRALASDGIAVPDAWLDPEAAVAALAGGRVRFPLVVKPRHGHGGIDVHVVHDAGTLRAAATLVAATGDDPLVEARIVGIEHGVDVLHDLEGRPLQVVVKRKLAMHGGETLAAVTVDAPAVAETALAVSALVRPRGGLDLDVIVTPDGRVVVLDANPRFGGGHPFTRAAGADFPGALVDLAAGRTPTLATARLGVTAVRDLRTVIVDLDGVDGTALTSVDPT